MTQTKRKLHCKTCGTTKNSATGETLFVLGEGAYMATMNTEGECFDCGEKRRDAEEKRRQQNAKQFSE